MMRFTVLASGSKGNATIVESQGYRILIDCGLSLRELTKRLALVGLEPSDLNALLITHFHSDHVRGVPSILDKLPLEVFSRPGLPGLSSRMKFHELQAYKDYELEAFRMTAMPLPHDNGGSFGFILANNSDNLVFATDLGAATEDLAYALRSANATIIESNHDIEMLSTCSYPDFIKERIRSDYGHLSNCQTAELLAKNLSRDCQHIVLAHLSERANHPAQALATMHHAINKKVEVASQFVPTAWFDIRSTSEQTVSLSA